jgi:septal ring-binding cell division protein DamX
LVVKLVILGLLSAGVVSGLSYLEWREQQVREIKAVQLAVEKVVAPAKTSVNQRNKIHTIQVAAVTSSRQAKRLVSALKKKGVKGLYTIKAKRKSGGTWYKIRAGQFDSKEDARKFANHLMESKAIKNYFVISFSRPAQ